MSERIKLFLLWMSLFMAFLGFAQKDNPDTFLDLNVYSGNIARHNNNITHLIQGHPNGIIFGWNKRVSGQQQWHKDYNYPEVGISFVAQNFNNPSLGRAYGFYGHSNFYFFRRHLRLRVGQGISYATNPYDKINNPKNIAFGSKLLSGTYLMLNYAYPYLFGKIGIQLGITLLHLSNANIKAPNTSINTIAFNFGLTSAFGDSSSLINHKIYPPDATDKTITYGVLCRTGINQSDVVGSSQYPFYVFSVYAEKRITSKSLLMMGTELFLSKFLEEYIYYQSVAYPEIPLNRDVDYKRVGIYGGHELLFGQFSIQIQLGYYIYYPFEFEGRFYNRIGLKQYLNSHWFLSTTLKAHAAKAEALELSIGYRL